jgi:hypothetical protein
MNEFELEYKRSWSSHYLTVKFEDEEYEKQEIEMDIEKREYPIGPDGKKIWDHTKAVSYIDPKYIDMISDVLYDISNQNTKEHDNSDLIYALFENLPEECRMKTFQKIYEENLAESEQEQFYIKES